MKHEKPKITPPISVDAPETQAPRKPLSAEERSALLALAFDQLSACDAPPQGVSSKPDERWYFTGPGFRYPLVAGLHARGLVRRGDIKTRTRGFICKVCLTQFGKRTVERLVNSTKDKPEP